MARDDDLRCVVTFPLRPLVERVDQLDSRCVVMDKVVELRGVFGDDVIVVGV